MIARPNKTAMPKGVVHRGQMDDITIARWLNNERVKRFQRVYEAVDQILNPQTRSLSVQEFGDEAPPAWTDGANVCINQSRLPKLHGATRADLLVWLGVNVHEVGHVTHTPRADSPLMVRIMAMARAYSGLPRTANLLEDQRQERLMIAQYPPLKPYLMAAANHFFKADEWAAQAAWPLLCGRTWLDVDLRRAARDVYPGTRAEANRIAKIVGEYQKLGDPGVQEADEAYELIWELFTLMHDGGVQPPIGCGLGSNNVPMNKGDDAPAIADEDDVPVAGGDWDDLDEADESEDYESDEEDGVGRASQDEESEDEGDGEGDAEGDGDGDADDGEDDAGGKGGDGETGDADGSGSGEGKGEGESDTDTDTDASGAGAGSEGHGSDELDPEAEAMAKAWDDIQQGIADQIGEEIAQSPKSESELKRLSATLEGKVTPPEVNDAKGGFADVDPALGDTARELTKAFRLYTDAAQPYWEREVSEGRINVRRMMEADRKPDLETAYDRFHPGQLDEMSLEVVVLLDRSGSMGNGHGSLNQRAAAAGWAIRRAVHEAEGRCTIVAYDTGATIVAHGGVKPQRERYEVMTMGGSTDPTEAIDYAWAVLSNSNAAHRMIVALTDGDWSGGKGAMLSARAKGVTTIGVLVQDAKDSSPFRKSVDAVADAMNTEFTGRISDPMDMVPIFEAVATDLLEKVKAQGR